MNISSEESAVFCIEGYCEEVVDCAGSGAVEQLASGLLATMQRLCRTAVLSLRSEVHPPRWPLLAALD